MKEQSYINRYAIESSINAVVISDLKGKLTYINRSFLKTWGYNERSEVLGKDAEELWQRKDDASLIIDELHKNGYWIGELVAIKKDGSLFDVHLSASLVKDMNGKPVAMMGSFIDITERKIVEKALRDSEDRYRTLFENASDAIFIADTKSYLIVDANRQAEDLMGRPREEIIGMHQSELHPPDQAEHYKEKFNGHVQKGRVFDLEADVIKKDGTIVPVIICAGIINIDGKEMIQGLFKDISKEKVILDLKAEIASRKLVARARGILIDSCGLSEKEAMRRLQKEARRQRKKIQEIAQAVISSETILD